MRYKRCAVPSCGNSYKNNLDVGYFMFPRNERVRSEWFKFINNPPLESMDYDILRHKYSVCGAHFEGWQFKIPGGGLNRNMVPTILKPPSPNPEINGSYSEGTADSPHTLGTSSSLGLKNDHDYFGTQSHEESVDIQDIPSTRQMVSQKRKRCDEDVETIKLLVQRDRGTVCTKKIKLMDLRTSRFLQLIPQKQKLDTHMKKYERLTESQAEASGDATQKSKDQRRSRDISVETFPSRLETPREDWGLLPICSRETTPLTEKEPEESKTEIGFFSGNPFVEITKGILHLYKEDVLSDRKEALTLCLLGVPTSMTCHDLLAFTAPCHADIAHIRVLRDSMPNQYMALLTFRTHESAMEFYMTFNGGPFNSLEPDNICRIVWVSRVEWAHDGVPPPGHTELPICPVCLERMDESVDGVLTILCNHAFHANCLEQWGDSTCPVCRCVQSPEQAASSECEKCGKVVQSADALWICLICGHVGCGRYQGGHAALHYRESGHCYALQLGSHRVWDYKGDNFVHRLLQNKADGKLVPSEGPPSEAECAQEKVDSVQLEFTYLLTSQLEEQRLYFEEKLTQLESLYYVENQELRTEVANLTEMNKDLKAKLAALNKEKLAVEKKLNQQSIKLTTSINELNEERQLGKALRNNQQQWQNKLTKLQEENENKDKEITELKEQVRDLMFFIDAQRVIEKSEDREEIAEGTITVGPEPARNKTKKGKKKR